jgi:hypothetical protein
LHFTLARGRMQAEPAKAATINKEATFPQYYYPVIMASKSDTLFEEIAASLPGAVLGKMFGSRCIKAPNGKAGAILWRDQLVIKPSKAAFDDMVKSGYAPFSPSEGKTMNGWVVIPEEQSDKWTAFAEQSYNEIKLLEKKK